MRRTKTELGHTTTESVTSLPLQSNLHPVPCHSAIPLLVTTHKGCIHYTYNLPAQQTARIVDPKAPLRGDRRAAPRSPSRLSQEARSPQPWPSAHVPPVPPVSHHITLHCGKPQEESGTEANRSHVGLQRSTWSLRKGNTRTSTPSEEGRTTNTETCRRGPCLTDRVESRT